MELTKMSEVNPPELPLASLLTSLASRKGFFDMVEVLLGGGGGCRNCGELLAFALEGEGEAARLRKGLLEDKLTLRPAAPAPGLLLLEEGCLSAEGMKAVLSVGALWIDRHETGGCAGCRTWRRDAGECHVSLYFQLVTGWCCAGEELLP